MEGKIHIIAQLSSFRGSNRAVDAHNGGLEARNVALEEQVVADSHHFDEELKREAENFFFKVFLCWRLEGQ
jgi:hypothetical protein